MPRGSSPGRLLRLLPVDAPAPLILPGRGRRDGRPRRAPRRAPFRVDMSAYPLEDKTALLALGVRYGLGIRNYLSFFSGPTHFYSLLFCDGAGLYWCMGGGTNPDRSTPLGVAWVNVKLIGPGAAPDNPRRSRPSTRRVRRPGGTSSCRAARIRTWGTALSNQVWDFGDGSPTAGGPAATHTYTKPGTFTAKLTVTDTHGVSRATSHAPGGRRPAAALPGDRVPRSRHGPLHARRHRHRARARRRDRRRRRPDLERPLRGPGDGGDPRRRRDRAVAAGRPAGPHAAAGDHIDLDVVYQPVGVGKFELTSTIAGTDAAGQPQGPRTATKNGNISALKVLLDAGGVTDDAFDVTMTVQEPERLPGQRDHLCRHRRAHRPSVSVPEHSAARSASRRPTPALPDTLGPGQQATATFHLRG